MNIRTYVRGYIDEDRGGNYMFIQLVPNNVIGSLYQVNIVDKIIAPYRKEYKFQSSGYGSSEYVDSHRTMYLCNIIRKVDRIEGNMIQRMISMIVNKIKRADCEEIKKLTTLIEIDPALIIIKP